MSDLRLQGLLNTVHLGISYLDAPPWAVKQMLKEVVRYFESNNFVITDALSLPYGRSPANLTATEARTHEQITYQKMKDHIAFLKCNQPVLAFSAIVDAMMDRQILEEAVGKHECNQMKEDTMLPDNTKDAKKPENRAVELLKAEEASLERAVKMYRADQATYQRHVDTYKKSGDEKEAELKQVRAALKKIS